MTQSVANQSPQKFLINRENTGNFALSIRLGTVRQGKKPAGALAFSENSLEIGTGNLERGSEILTVWKHS
jgi:hypothetical protein